MKDRLRGYHTEPAGGGVDLVVQYHFQVVVPVEVRTIAGPAGVVSGIEDRTREQRTHFRMDEMSELAITVAALQRRMMHA